MLQENTESPIYAPDFELPGTDGKVHHLSRYLENFSAIAVIFLCNQCPSVRAYLDRIKDIQAEFASAGFTLIGINANDTSDNPEEDFAHMKHFATEMDLNFPYLWDSSQDVASAFQAHVTPEVFLIDKKAVICYRGGIDNNQENPEAVTTPYLYQAIQSLLNNEPIAVNRTQAEGSPIRWHPEKAK